MIKTVQLDAMVDLIMKEVQEYALKFPNESERKKLIDKISDIVYDNIDSITENDENEFEDDEIEDDIQIGHNDWY